MRFQRKKFKNIISSFYTGGGMFPSWPPNTVFDLIHGVIFTCLVGWFLFPLIALDCIELQR